MPDELLQKIAQENNLSETAFFVASAEGIKLRWFTPNGEVDLCGHATLAAAHVLFQHLAYSGTEIKFQTKSGELIVGKTDTGYAMDFPASKLTLTEPPADLLQGLGVKPAAVYSAFDYVVVLDNEAAVRNLKPQFANWLDLDLRGVVVTAMADNENIDFVSRCFFPKLNVNEDPVTGSAYCELAPYWAKHLNKPQLIARQLSNRSGLVNCKVKGDRVILVGTAVDYMQGSIRI